MGIGNDIYVVDDLSDQVFEKPNEGNDTVISYLKDYVLPANVENLTLDVKLSPFGNAFQVGWNGIGNSLDNIIHGNAFNNIILGGGGHDSLFSGNGSDTVDGGNGDDYIWGVGQNFGRGEIDILTGGQGKDTFVLASSSQQRLFYNDGNANEPFNPGNGDYAQITGFEIGTDRLILKGSASNYYIQSAPQSLGVSGQAIYYKSWHEGQNTSELIAVLEGKSDQQVSQNFLNSNNVSYV